MTCLDVAKGFPLPLVRPNSKDAFGKLKDSESGSGSIHGESLAPPAIYHQLVRCGQCMTT
jgi:hypothetical protein